MLFFASFGNWCKNLLNTISGFISAGLLQFSKSLECWDVQNFLPRAPGGFFACQQRADKVTCLILGCQQQLSQHPVVFQGTAIWSHGKGGLQPWIFELWWSLPLPLRWSESCRELQQWLSCTQLGCEAMATELLAQCVWVWTRNHWSQCKIT